MFRTHPLFAGLTEQDKDDLFQHGKVRSNKRGPHLFACGDRIDFCYIVCGGVIQLYRETPGGQELTCDIMEAGDIIEAGNILQEDALHQMSARVAKDATVMALPALELKKHAMGNSVLALNLLAMVSQRARINTMQAEHKSAMTAPQQLACFLQRMCILHDFDPSGFELPYSKSLIASRLGMELETLSRALIKLRDQSIVVQGTHVSFKSYAAMQEFVCKHCAMINDCKEQKALGRLMGQAGLPGHRAPASPAVTPPAQPARLSPTAYATE